MKIAEQSTLTFSMDNDRPTADGSLPPQGQYGLIDFYANFDRDGR